MSLRHTLAAAAAIACCVSAAPASADVLATLEFTQPTGTVGPNDPVEVWLKLSLDASSDALVFDAPNGVLPNSSLLPTDGYYYDENNNYQVKPFASYDASRTSTSSGYGCSGNFWNGCSGGQSYEFSWNFGADAFNGLTSLNLQPGESMTYLFGTFTPRPAGADAGTYSFSSSHAAFWVYGKSADGDDLQQWVSLAQTCPGGGDCAFTRVVEVPEPGTYALMGAGSLLLGWVARRRRMR